MSNNESLFNRRKFVNYFHQKFLPRSRALSASNAQDSTTANPIDAATSSPPLFPPVSPSSLTTNQTENDGIPTSVLGTASPDRVAGPDRCSYMLMNSPALASVPRCVLSSTTEDRNGSIIPDMTTPASTQPSSSAVPPRVNILLDMRPDDAESGLSAIKRLVVPTGIVADASAPIASTVYPLQDPISNSSTKEFLRTTWHGIVYLLKNVEKCLDGTPFKAPVAAINIVIEIGNTVIDNKDTLQELVTQMTMRLQMIDSELTKDKDMAPKKIIECFVGKLVAELVKLEKMSKQGTWKRIMDNEENKKRIEETFKQVDEHIKDLQLYLMIRMDRNIHDLSRGLTRLELGSWPHSTKARYDARFEESTSLIRRPCKPETRTSILADIYKWATSPDTPSIFWLTGEAGSGKSTLACTVATHFGNDGNILGGNFFCSRQFGETREQRNLIPTIVYQLARKSRLFAQALLDADIRDSVDCILSKQIEDLLVGPWQESASKRPSDFPPYLVVVDALDEIDGSGGWVFLEKLINTIKDGHLQRLKFLITSRPDPKIASLCDSFASKTICHLYDVPRATVKADITTYLEAELPALKGHEQLIKLADKADGLFVYAATVVRHVKPDPDMTKGEQLELMSELLSDNVSPMYDNHATPSLVDKLYEQILGTAFSKLNQTQFRTRLNILHTILCTQERVSIPVAAALHSDSDDMREIADIVVKKLHAVLYVKDSCVFWYHASFPDFIFTPTRSKFTLYIPSLNTPVRNLDMFCDKAFHHALLARSCFRIMMSPSPIGLRFNICNLPSSFLLDSEVSELDVRIRENISDILRYCCRYWVQHLEQVTRAGSDDLFDRIEEFLAIHVLFWIEAMNLLEASALCTTILQKARKTALKYADKHTNLAEDLTAVANFATYFSGSPAASSTPHLYISSLATWSHSSTVSQRWQKQFLLLPTFKRTSGKGGHSVPLMTIPTTDEVHCVAFSNDATRIVSGLSDNSVMVWDASSGAKLEVLTGHTYRVSSVAFSNDGTRIVSGSWDHSVRVWDASSGAQLQVLSGHTKGVESVVFSNDGTRIVSGSEDRSVRVWNALNGAKLKILTGHTDGVLCVAFSNDSARIVSGSEDNSVRVWDPWSTAEVEVLTGHTNPVWSVAFSNDGARIVSGSEDSSIRVWDVSSGAQLQVLTGHNHGVWSVAFSNDGARIVSGSQDRSIRVWDASSGVELEVLTGHTDAVQSVAFSSDGTRIVSGSLDSSVRVWASSSRAKLQALTGHTDRVWSVAFSSDGVRIVSGSKDHSARVWDASSDVELDVLTGHTDVVLSVAFSSDGTRIVSGSEDNSIRVWDSSSGAELEVLTGHTDGVLSVAISDDGTRIVSGSEDNSIRVWDATNGAQLQVLTGHIHAVQSVTFSSDGTRIVSGSLDNSVRVWDASTGAVLDVLSGHPDAVLSVAFSNNGTLIVSGSLDGSVRVWDTSSGKQLKVLTGHADAVLSVAFSNDDTRIVSGSSDHSVRVWAVSSGAELEVLTGHTDRVRSVGFSNDDARIVSGSDDGSVRVWDLQHYDDFRWVSNGPNWIVSKPGERRLVCLPPGLLQVLQRPYNILTISREGFAQIDFRSCKVGPYWPNCYTPVPS